MADQFKPRRRSEKLSGLIENLKRLLLDSLEEIKEAFSSHTSQGPSAVARFLGTEDARTGSYQRIRAFFTNLET